ncbi:cytochrome b/b6 domain-containing protein [Methylobacter sp. sgz302048]|uniref:cytochrome b/b6 domain-containing protein n=1 Tax=Methylobacter sp. sgz302048 TaxID=3455945 RepID=UPI003F9FDF80
MTELKRYTVWDAGTRWFHWINVFCVTVLAAVGLVILNAGDLGVHNAGKVTLKTVHAWVGYLFALNLLWRIVWGFWGNRYARWRSILPGGRGYFGALRRYAAAFFASRPEQYLGHNPIGRLSVTAILLFLTVQAITGLVLAGTDLFYPPIGHWIAQWVAASGVSPDSLVPYTPEMYDAAAYEVMRAYRKPVAVVHLYSFYILTVIVILHVAAVIITELREGGGIISAMFSGQKVISGIPVDKESGDSDISS